MAHFYRPGVSFQLGSTPPGSLGLAEGLGPFTFGEGACLFFGLGKVNFLAAMFPSYPFPFSCLSLPKGGGHSCPSPWFAVQALLIYVPKLH